MLETISVRNLVLIEEAEVSLGPGLNVLSGETGVGKSLFLTAVGLLLGDRGDADVVRAGAEDAVVEGRLVLEGETLGSVRAALPDIDFEDGEVVLRRIQSAGGRSRCSVNGRLVTLSALRELTRGLVDIQGQREHQSLLRAEAQCEVLDRFGGLLELRAEFRKALDRTREIEEAVRHHDATSAEADLLAATRRHFLEEITAIAPVPGEVERLSVELRLLDHADALLRAAGAGVEMLAEAEDSAADRLARLARDLSPAAELSDRARTLAEELREFSRELGRFRDSLSVDPGRREVVESRLGNLRDLLQKHRTDEAGLTDLAERLRAEVAEDAARPDRAGLASALAGSCAEVLRLGNLLLDGRRRAGRRLEDRVRAEFTDLRLPDARLAVEPGAAASYRTTADGPISALGLGTPGFLFAPNPGEPPRPLGDIASGGEIVRVLLALKAVLAEAHHVPLLILDEIESGIGGRLGMALGRRLRRIAACHQVLCITHLPQIACFADRHVKVVKTVQGGRTVTRFRDLRGKERLGEIAEMLAGDPAGPAALRQAGAMLEEAEAAKAGS